MNISASPLMCGGPLLCLPFPLLGLDRLGRAPQWAAWALGSECGLCSRARPLLLALDLGTGPWQRVRGEAVLRGTLDESDFHLNQAGSSASNCPALAPLGVDVQVPVLFWASASGTFSGACTVLQ